MKNNLFEMGANFDDTWQSDNKNKISKTIDKTIKIPKNHQLHFSKEKRRGKVVTIVKPFYLDKITLSTLLKSLKKKLGTGGTIKENTLEFQGDIKETLKIQLLAEGYVFKR